ncbi:MAG: hypothetical protein AB4062_13335 [Crocosphaera sp.]
MIDILCISSVINTELELKTDHNQKKFFWIDKKSDRIFLTAIAFSSSLFKVK